MPDEAPAPAVATTPAERPSSRHRSTLELARAGWAAFRSEDPRALERLLESGDLVPTPDLAAAFERHLEQFPGTRDGLSRSERQAVAALAGGVLPFEELFDRSQRDEERRFLGDLVLRSYLARLAAPPQGRPLPE